MTRSDFQLIADVVLESNLSVEEKQKLAEAFAAKLFMTNPRFDRSRFIRACLGQK